MSFKTVLKNLIKQGPIDTLLRYGIRHNSPVISDYKATVEKDLQKKAKMDIRAVDSYYKKYLSAVEISKYMKSIGDFDRAEAADELASDILILQKIKDPEALEDINQKIIDLETAEYKRFIKSEYLKTVVPGIYDRYKDREIENKILFLQPRRTLNPSCKLLFNTLKKLGRSEVELHELFRWRVSVTEEYLNLLDFIKEMATAKAVVLHEFNEYFGHIQIRPETKMIQLWHGCGIIKCLGMDTCGMPGEEFKTREEYEEYPEFEQYDLVTIPSDAERPIFESFMGRPKGAPEISSIGVSRTDVFFDDSYLKNARKKLNTLIPNSVNKKIILYAPTFRGTDPGRTAPDELDIRRFADAFSKEYILLLKYHQTIRELPEIPKDLNGTFAFDLTHGSGMDINELLSVSDMLISDYSSVVFEFSLFERPVFFFLYDYEDYKASRKMYYDINEMRKWGSLCETNDELIEQIKLVGSDFDKSAIISFREKYMNACDGHSTERIVDFIYS